MAENKAPERKKRGPGRRFQKGQSGNPGGRPKELVEVRELARQHTPAAIETLAAIAKTADSDAARVAACKELLDRAWGKAPLAITADLTFQDLTDEQLEVKFLKLLGEHNK